MSTPTALYLRVSSRKQVTTGASLPDQLARLRHEARNAGETIVFECIDQARSGTSTERRPEYQKLLAAARRKEFDQVRVESVDRGHRNEDERRQFEAEMRAHRVKVIYSGEPERQSPHYRKFTRSARGIVAELDPDETPMRTYRRHLYRAKKGKWRGGPIPYGLLPDGNDWFKPDSETYSVLIWILERRAEGLGYHRIARLLNTGVSLEGAPTAFPPTPAICQHRRKPYRELQDPETGDVIRLEHPLPDASWKPQTIRHICRAAVDGVYAGILQWGRGYGSRSAGPANLIRYQRTIVFPVGM